MANACFTTKVLDRRIAQRVHRKPPSTTSIACSTTRKEDFVCNSGPSGRWRYANYWWCMERKKDLTCACLLYPKIYYQVVSTYVSHIGQQLLCFGRMHARINLPFHPTKPRGSKCTHYSLWSCMSTLQEHRLTLFTARGLKQGAANMKLHICPIFCRRSRSWTYPACDNGVWHNVAEGWAQ